MNPDSVSHLDAAQLVALGRATRAVADCPACGPLICPGWEALAGSFDRSVLRLVGSLRDLGEDAVEPTFEEYHPAGTNAWSADAPIAPCWFPYNRCDAFQCVTCGRPFLRYTEAGGYYVEERIRELNPDLVVDVGR